MNVPDDFREYAHDVSTYHGLTAVTGDLMYVISTR